ncbi:hypothetical protein [Mycobacterium sp. DL440]|uniref:hypothetical protein n=1 Tax=Mycobacterium sp. DL440 TaxID=2675523 RepID=UPI00141ECC94|nr:hypothetical protein [Mycobacterium sp. DL440]
MGASLSGFAGGTGGAQNISGKQEVRQMLERASYLPAVVEPPDSHAVMYVNDIGAQLNSDDSRISKYPTGRLACAESGVAA